MENTSKEINNIITVDQVDHDVTELAFNLLKAPFVSVKDSLLTNNIRLPRKLRMDAMKVSLRPLIVKTRNECLTLDQQLNYRLLWFNKFSEGQMAFYFGHFKDKELNKLYGQKLYKNILLTLANGQGNEEYQNCLRELITLATSEQNNDYKDIKIKDFIPAFDPIFYDPKNFLDGLPVSEFRPICYNSATKDQLMNIGEKYNIEVPKKINKDTIFDYVVCKLRAMKVDPSYLVENEKTLKVKDIREFAFQQGLDTAGELTKKEVIEYILQRALTTKDNYECPRSSQVYEMNIPISDEEAIYDKLMVERIRIQEEIKRETDALRRLQGEELAKAQAALEEKTRENEETEKELERVKNELESKFEAESLKSMEELDQTLDDYNFDEPTNYNETNEEIYTQTDSNYTNIEDKKEGETLYNNQSHNDEPEVIDIDDMDFGDFSEQLKEDKPNNKKAKKQQNDQFATSATGNSLMIYQSANELMVIQKATKKKAKLGSIYAMVALFIVSLIVIGIMVGVLKHSQKLTTVSYEEFAKIVNLEKNNSIKIIKSQSNTLSSPITATVEAKPRSLISEQPFDAFQKFKQKIDKNGLQIPYDYRIHRYQSDSNPGLTYFKDNTSLPGRKIDFKLAFETRQNTNKEKYCIEIFSKAKKVKAFVDLQINFNNIVEIFDTADNSFTLTLTQLEHIDTNRLTSFLSDTVIQGRKSKEADYKPTELEKQDTKEWYLDSARVTQAKPDEIITKLKEEINNSRTPRLYASQKRTLGLNVAVKFINPDKQSDPVSVSFAHDDDPRAIEKLNSALSKINDILAKEQSNYTVDGWKMLDPNATGLDASIEVLKSKDEVFNSDNLNILRKRFPTTKQRSVTIDLTAKFNREFIQLVFQNEDGNPFEVNPFEGGGEWPIKSPLKGFNVDELITKYENKALRDSEIFKKADSYFSHWEIVYGAKRYTLNDLKNDPNINFETIIGTDNLKEVEKIELKPIYRRNLEIKLGFEYSYAAGVLSELANYLHQPYRDNIRLYHDTTIDQLVKMLVGDEDFVNGITESLSQWGRPYANDEEHKKKIKESDFNKDKLQGKVYISELSDGELKLSPEFKPIAITLNKEVVRADKVTVETEDKTENIWVNRNSSELDLNVIKDLYKNNPEELKGLYVATPKNNLKITKGDQDDSTTIELKLYRVLIDLKFPKEDGQLETTVYRNFVYGQEAKFQIPEYQNFNFKGFTKKQVHGIASDSEYLYQTTEFKLELNYENLEKAKGLGLVNFKNIDKLDFVSNQQNGILQTLKLFAYYERKKTGSLTFTKTFTSKNDNLSTDGVVESEEMNNLPLGLKFEINFISLQTFTIIVNPSDGLFSSDPEITKIKNKFNGELFVLTDENKTKTYNKKVYTLNSEVNFTKTININADAPQETISLLYNRKEVKLAIKPNSNSYESLMQYNVNNNGLPIKELSLWVGAEFVNGRNNWIVLEPNANETYEFKYFTFVRGGVADVDSSGSQLKLLYDDLKNSHIKEIEPFTTSTSKPHELRAHFNKRSAKIYPFFVYTNEENNQFDPSFTSITNPGSTASRYREACTIDGRQLIIDAEVGRDKLVDLLNIQNDKGTKQVDIKPGFEIVSVDSGGFGSSYTVGGSSISNSNIKVFLYFKLSRKQVKLTISDKKNEQIKADVNLFAGVHLTSSLIADALQSLETQKNQSVQQDHLTDTYSIDTNSLYLTKDDSSRKRLTDITLTDIKGQGNDLFSQLYCGFILDEVTMTLYIIESDHNNEMPDEFRNKVNFNTNALINPKEKLEGENVVEAVFQVRANEEILNIFERFVQLNGLVRDGFREEKNELGQPVPKAIKLGAKNSENAFFFLLKRNRYTVKLFDSTTNLQINSDIPCYHGLSLISALGGIDPNNGGTLNGKPIKGFINRATNAKFNENDPILSDLELIVQF